MSLHEKYTREEFEDKENQIKRNKKDSLDIYDLLKPIKCSKIIDKAYDSEKINSFLVDEIGHLPDKFLKEQINSFSNGLYRYINIHKIPESDYKFAENIEEKLNKEIYGTSIIEAIHHKVYEKQIYGENPKVAIVSLEGYDAIQKLHEFEIKAISIRGCELKLYPSPMLSKGQIEIY